MHRPITRHLLNISQQKNYLLILFLLIPKSKKLLPITVCGRLVGANVERCSFEFITVSNESIKGQLTPALSSSVFSVPQSVEADIEIRIGSDSMTREEKLLYTLTAIRPIVPQSETEI